MKILIIGKTSSKGNASGSYSRKHVEQIQKVAKGAKVVIAQDQRSVLGFLKEAEILIVSPVGFNLNLAGAKNLKWIHSTSAGVKDLVKMLAGSNIRLTNSSGVHPIPIAEHVFAFMLMFARQIDKSFKDQVLLKKWRRDIENLQVFELFGKNVGIVGYGRIGKRIAHIAKAFGMKTSALGHTERIIDKNIDKVYKSVDLQLKNSDFVVDCLPETKETLGFFNIAKFKMMKKSAYFINIGRGRTAVEKDLIRALKTKIIAGAGLDVFEVEPLAANSPLWGLENVIITPHYSGWTPKYSDRVIEIFCRNLKAYLLGKHMPNLVNKSRGY